MRNWRRSALRLVLVALLIVLAVAARTRGAEAHGKEVTIVLRCAEANPSAPLDRHCEATVTSRDDGDPYENADLTLTAVRTGKNEPGITGVRFVPTGLPGTYAADFDLPSYGDWEFRLAVRQPAEGEVRLAQRVLPPSGSAGPAGQVRVQLLKRFDLGDVANIAALGLHLAGTIALLGANAAVVIVGALAVGPSGIRTRRAAVRLLPWLVAVSFALLAGSGAYNAAYNSPARSPGLFEPGRIEGLPFGDAYLVLFALKMALAGALFAGTTALIVVLHRAPGWRALPIAGGSQASVAPVEAAVASLRRPIAAGHDSCMILALLNLFAGAGILILVLVIDYLHLLSHAQALAAGA